jgi:hypothetical protein
MELAPYFQLVKHQQVVKASQGHFPQPFLIRDVVRTGAKISCLFSYFQILGFFFGPHSSLIARGKILKIEIALASGNKVYTDSTTS